MLHIGCFLFLASLLMSSDLLGKTVLTGVVRSELDQKPIELAVVLVPSRKQKTHTDSNGRFSIDLIKPGEYQILIRSNGYVTLEQTIDIQRSESRTFTLKLARIKAKALKIEEKNKRQKIARKTMSQEQLKQTPAGFGDALGALTSLPGIIKSEGFSGSIILRGSIDDGNKYMVDGIPLFYPKHYGGFALVFPNNMIKKTHVFASSPPIEFSQTYGGVIEVETEDDIKEFQGKIDTIPLSLTSVYFQGKLGSDSGSLFGYTPDNPIPQGQEGLEGFLKGSDEGYGYWIVSARYGYLETVFRPLYDSIFPELSTLRVNYPTFWDYQAKLNFNVSPNSKHNWKFFAFGSIDIYRKEAEKLSTSDRAQTLAENNDAIANVTQIDSDLSSHTQSLYYTYKPRSNLQNEFIFYTSFNETKNYKFIPEIPEIELEESEIQNSLKANIFAVKNTYSWGYIENISTIYFGVEAQYIEYNSSGTTDFIKLANLNNLENDVAMLALNPDFEPNDIIEIIPADFSSSNFYSSAYLKNEFDHLGWFFALGGRADHLRRTGTTTFSGWGNLGYEFATQTTVSTAGGYYNSFPQINFYKINKPISQQYQISILDSEPERASHLALGVEQKFLDAFSVSVEGFYNLFYDILYLDYDSSLENYISKTSDLRHLGAEIFFKKDAEPDREDYFFWIGYTFADSNYKNPDTGNVFVPYSFEQEHAIKLVTGYRWISHQVGLRYEVYSGFAYTPYSEATNGYPTPLGTVYYPPSTEGSAINSRNYPFIHRLDIRYTYINYNHWGKWSAYIEILNAYNFRGDKRQSWNFFRDYEPGRNPVLEPSPADLPILINLGIEIQF